MTYLSFLNLSMLLKPWLQKAQLKAHPKAPKAIKIKAKSTPKKPKAAKSTESHHALLLMS